MANIIKATHFCSFLFPPLITFFFKSIHILIINNNHISSLSLILPQFCTYISTICFYSLFQKGGVFLFGADFIWVI
ncbi:hypothetical protein ACJIZ3_006279 [Penstemon smallii]|uniref:Uncharacterized protein n=1 Tax=Penstemon smallii TaxID=265156 RepID=A0ABD3S7A9_9LAMI